MDGPQASVVRKRRKLPEQEMSRLTRALTEAQKQFDAGQYGRALKGFTVYIRSGLYERRTARILFDAAYAAYKAKVPPLFREYSHRLKRLFPAHSNNRGLSGLNWEICLMEKRYKAAIREIRLLLAQKQHSKQALSRFHYTIADCYEKLFIPASAVEAYLQVVRNGNRDSYLAAALYRLARWALVRKDRELALHYALRVIREFPDSAERVRAEALRRVVRWRYLRKEHGLADDSISDIEFDGDDVWVATWLGGISRFTRSTGSVVRFRASKSGLVSNLVRSLAVGQSRVWAATYAGLSYYSKALGVWKTVDTVAGLRWQRIKKALLYDKKLWVATIAHGLSVLDLRTGEWVTYKKRDGLPGNNIVTLCATPGSVWAGTVAGGIGRLDLKSGRWTVYRKGGAGRLPTNNVKSIAFDGTRVWFGTHGHGAVSCTEKGTAWRLYNAGNSGLRSNYVYSLAVSPAGRVWMGMLEGGAASFDPLNNKWETYGIRDGLPSNDITIIAFEGRYVWFGTLNGGVAVLLSDEREKKSAQK